MSELHGSKQFRGRSCQGSIGASPYVNRSHDTRMVMISRTTSPATATFSLPASSLVLP